MRSHTVAAMLAAAALFGLVGCGTGGDTSLVTVTNSADFPVDVTVEVRGVPGKIECEDEVCGPVTDPGIGRTTETVQPGESLERSVELRTQSTSYGYEVLDEFIITIETEQAGESTDRRLHSVGAQAASVNLGASLITALGVEITGFGDDILAATCTVEFDTDDEVRDCDFALLL